MNETIETARDICYSHEGCPIAKTMSVMGNKWKPMLLYMIAGGVNRFGKLRGAIEGLTKHVLNRGLRELESDGLISREVFQERVLRVEYKLTDKGESLMPIVHALYEWGKANA